MFFIKYLRTLGFRKLHISGLLNEEKVDIGDTKVDIENEKVDIQDKKVDIESVLSEKGSDFSVKTTIHIHRLFEKFGFDEVFGRSAVMELLELKGTTVYKLGQLVLVNLNIFDEYIETFHIVDDEYYK